MFALVADIECYPEFLPWVIGVRIKNDSETETIADMIAGFRALRETFSSRIHKRRPHHIEVDYLDGPLRHLHNEWQFRPDGKDSCQLSFMVDFSFRSRLFEALAGQMFAKALSRMTAAFETRAETLYAGCSGATASEASDSRLPPGEAG